MPRCGHCLPRNHATVLLQGVLRAYTRRAGAYEPCYAQANLCYSARPDASGVAVIRDPSSSQISQSARTSRTGQTLVPVRTTTGRRHACRSAPGLFSISCGYPRPPAYRWAVPGVRRLMCIAQIGRPLLAIPVAIRRTARAAAPALARVRTRVQTRARPARKSHRRMPTGMRGQ